MPEIPIFDSLTHPTIDGGWLSPDSAGGNRIEDLILQMQAHDVRWAFAVGMGEGVGGYSAERYAEFVRKGSDALLPVAFVDFRALSSASDVVPYLRRLEGLGYAGVKIHPRLAGVGYDHACMPELIRQANRLGLAVLLCTYFYQSSPRLADQRLGKLIELLARVPDEKILLLHGGTVQLLQLAEVVRVFPNALLDLSFTLCKYAGSSLDADIAFLFRSFDQRICIGSDAPEFGLGELRSRFEHFARGVERGKLENIAHRNLLRFAGLEAA